MLKAEVSLPPPPSSDLGSQGNHSHLSFTSLLGQHYQNSWGLKNGHPKDVNILILGMLPFLTKGSLPM